MNALWAWVKKNGYWLLLVVGSGLYTLCHKDLINELGHWNVYNSIFILWLILLLFPLISEMEFFGITIKKEVEKEVKKATEDQKEIIKFLQQQVSTLQMNSSINNHIQFSAPLPAEKELDEKLPEYADESKHNEIGALSSNADEQFAYVSEDNVRLFKSRLNIEISLRTLCEKIGHPYRMNVYQMVDLLIRCEVISAKTGDLIRQIQKISSHGVHGELISSNYITFVKKAYPIIMKELERAPSELRDIICPKCQYRGLSKYGNVCPRCGFVSDDD